MIDVLFSPEGLISLLTLTLLEIVLGIDNIIFISIVSEKLPPKEAKIARVVGLGLALLARIILLFAIAWIIGLDEPFFSILGWDVSGRDLILFGGGLFLLAKSTTEIHGKVSGFSEEDVVDTKNETLKKAIFQIVMLDIVFSFDSILTAVGLVDEIIIMVVAVIIAITVMLIFASAVSRFVNNNPTIKMLALSFLLMIGVLLIVEAFHFHVPKGYIYFAMAFSLVVELLNLKMMKNKQKKKTTA